MKTYAVLALVVAYVSMGTSANWKFACDHGCCNVAETSSKIIHPCESDLSYDCLRGFFSEHAECTVRSESVTSSTFEGDLPIYLSNINATLVTTKTTLSQYDGQVERFFVDTDTNNVVIALRVSELLCDAPDTLVAVKRLGREPKVVSEHIKAAYPEMLITAVIPMGDKMNIDSLRAASIKPYFENSNAVFDIGPKFSASQDSDIAASFNSLIQDVPTALLEIGGTKGSYAFLTFLQNCICDFNANPNIQHHFDTTVFKNIEASGNDESSLVQPCEGSKDMRLCVGNYLAEQGQCTQINQASDGPVSRALFNQYVPGLNVTAITMDSELSGLNGEIKSFYVNQKTNNYVLATEFKAIRMNSPAVQLVVYRKGEQPKTLTDYNRDVYPNVVLTTVAPAGVLTPEVILNQAYSSAYFLAEDAVYDLGEEYTENKDPQVMEVMRQVEVNPMLVTREIFESESYSVKLAYIQSNLCDYGIPM